MTDWIIDSIIFKHPFTCCIAGPTGAGKTVLLQKILINKKQIFDIQPDRIVVCYKSWQQAYEVFALLDTPVEFVEGLIDVQNFDKSKIIFNIFYIEFNYVLKALFLEAELFYI